MRNHQETDIRPVARNTNVIKTLPIRILKVVRGRYTGKSKIKQGGNKTIKIWCVWKTKGAMELQGEGHFQGNGDVLLEEMMPEPNLAGDFTWMTKWGWHTFCFHLLDVFNIVIGDHAFLLQTSAFFKENNVLVAI